MSKNKKINFTRYISIGWMLILVFPTIFVTGYGGSIGSYIGSALYMLVGVFGVWEILTSIGFNKYSSLITASLLFLFFLLGFKSYSIVAESNIVDPVILKTSLRISFNYKLYLIILLGSFLPIVLEPNVAKNKNGLIKTQCIVASIIIIAFTFFKGIWIINSVWKESIFFFIPIAIISDSFGYWGGKYFGKKLFKNAKLAPIISPKKTWAGALIGFIFSFAFTFGLGYAMDIWGSLSQNKILISIIMAILLSIASPIGDLFFSAIKRSIGIKDFSNLMPGHGGVFDRLDAISIVTCFSVWVFLIF